MLDSSALLGIVSMVKQEILLNNCRIMKLDHHLEVAMLFDLCELEWQMIWYIIDCIVLVTGLLANGAMLWVLLRGKNAFTASQVGAAQLIMLEAGPCRPTSGVPVRGKCHTSDHKFTLLKQQITCESLPLRSWGSTLLQ